MFFSNIFLQMLNIKEWCQLRIQIVIFKDERVKILKQNGYEEEDETHKEKKIERIFYSQKIVKCYVAYGNENKHD